MVAAHQKSPVLFCMASYTVFPASIHVASWLLSILWTVQTVHLGPGVPQAFLQLSPLSGSRRAHRNDSRIGSCELRVCSAHHPGFLGNVREQSNCTPAASTTTGLSPDFHKRTKHLLYLSSRALGPYSNRSLLLLETI